MGGAIYLSSIAAALVGWMEGGLIMRSGTYVDSISIGVSQHEEYSPFYF